MGANELKCNMIEEWKYIPNTNNRYKISNIGNILSLCNGRQHLLKPYITNSPISNISASLKLNKETFY